MTDLEWEEIRPTDRVRAVRVTTQNAQDIADHFGGEVEVIRGTTRLNFAETGMSGPARGWMRTNGQWLWNEDQWEPVDD